MTNITARLADALRHCVAVFNSMADRGAYPQELLPEDDYGNESPLFMGKQGWKFAADAIAAYESERVGWQPIDTAPKDGTEILACRKDCGVFMVRWTAPIAFLTDSELEDLDQESAEQDGWFYADFVAGGRLDGDEEPTHWMPLPAAPVQP